MKKIQKHLIDIINENTAEGESADLFAELLIGDFKASFRVHKDADRSAVIVQSDTADRVDNIE